MNNETVPTNPIPDSIAERREALKNRLSLALCTNQKDGHTARLEDQIAFAEEAQLTGVQFDFRNRIPHEMAVYKSSSEYAKYKKEQKKIAKENSLKEIESDIKKLVKSIKE